MSKLSIKDLELKGKRVLMRVDFNVPLAEDLSVSDDTRIKAVLPTIEYALSKGAKIILMSHLGRPDGKVVDKLKLDPVANKLSQILGKSVRKLNDCVGEDVEKEVKNMRSGDIILLENLRFHPEEEANDQEFSKKLASLADLFVNDAFGTAHRAHASTEGVTHYLVSAAGLLLDKEIEYLGKALEAPLKPYVAILGGAKVSDKIEVIENLMRKTTAILVGGGMAYTFLKAKGQEIGASKLEADKLGVAKEILDNAAKRKVNLVLPTDHVVVDKIENPASVEIVDDIPLGFIAVDIGPKTIDEFKRVLKSAKMIVWNGPLGIFERDEFSNGTREIAQYIITLKATTIIGGGDTAAAIAKFGLQGKVSHVSTGGGASLEFLEGKILPGIAALRDK